MAADRYIVAGNNVWIEPLMKGFRMACCDCGLVHDCDFRMSRLKEVEFRLRRNERATAAMRREMRKRGQDIRELLNTIINRPEASP